MKLGEFIITLSTEIQQFEITLRFFWSTPIILWKHFDFIGMHEVFPYPCKNGLPSFFHDMAYCTSFIEGWAVYGENPVLSDDVDMYKDNLLQRIGMLKWQVQF